MKGVLEFLGAYLYIAYRIIELPVLSLLYLMFGIILLIRAANQFRKMLPKLFSASVHSLQHLAKGAFHYGHKLHAWVYHK